MDVSRLANGQLALELSRFDIAALAHTVVERMRALGGSGDFDIEGPRSLIVHGDPLRIEQVIVNLLENAKKYGPLGGRISVSVTRPAPHTVSVSVRDHGVGIPTSELERVFERFYQVDTSERRTGLGLGLYVSREIIERHGGRIWAENPEGGGTRFVFEIAAPAAELDA